MKRVFTILLSLVMVLSIVGCGSQPKAEAQSAPAPVVEETKEVPKPVSEPVVIEEPEVIEEPVVIEEPEVIEEVPEPTYVEEKGIEIASLDGTYENTFVFTAFNYLDDEKENIDEENTSPFESKCTVTSETVDNGDGTKTVSYTAVFDITNWSYDYEFYSSDTYLVNTDNGRIFSNLYGDNVVEVNGSENVVTYNFEENYDEGFTTHTKVFSLTCPSDFEGYGLYLSDTEFTNKVSYYENLDAPLEQNDVQNRVIVK